MIIINLKEDLQTFWNQAVQLTHVKRVELWNSSIEKKHKKLFDEQVWRVPTRENWQSFKEEKLLETFSYYETHFDNVMELFDCFDTILDEQCKKYKSVFSDSDFSETPFYVMPSCMTFNGRGGSNSNYPDRPVMYVGIDYLSKRNDDLDLFFSHELFHMYHIERMKVDEKVFMSEGRLTLPLWLEGLATYVSGELCPHRSLSELLMDSNFKDVDETNVPKVCSKFKVIANEMIGHNEMKTYQSLFNFQSAPFVEELPSRVGYYLGYFVVKEILKNHELSNVVFWDHSKVHREVLIALEKLG